MSGYLFDKISSKYIILSTVELFTIFTILAGYVSNGIELVIYRFLVGVRNISTCSFCRRSVKYY
ncbi:hypothetical protein [Acidianus sp. HS-5]|uniref:hypothetical protein n=1 Tax=Acidianus sp. HS-5 TaxID=2886040 RepID=UPI001F360EEB|nr:hypothetical protein [Acidianus sp. HS-5]BDC18839.1 hypothetical protein HS5_17290 [Acidianus sp. HS-5]